MLVQMLTTQKLDRAGEVKTLRPGDFVNISRALAELWVREKKARSATNSDSVDPAVFADAGFLLCGEAVGSDYFAQSGVPVASESADCLPFPKTIRVSSKNFLDWERLACGVKLLNTWDCAIPLFPPSLLAAQVGEEQQRDQALAVLHDLRIPVYDPALMFLKQGGPCTALLYAWREEQERVGDQVLALLCALYRTPLFLCPLPSTWR